MKSYIYECLASIHVLPRCCPALGAQNAQDCPPNLWWQEWYNGLVNCGTESSLFAAPLRDACTRPRFCNAATMTINVRAQVNGQPCNPAQVADTLDNVRLVLAPVRLLFLARVGGQEGGKVVDGVQRKPCSVGHPAKGEHPRSQRQHADLQRSFRHQVDAPYRVYDSRMCAKEKEQRRQERQPRLLVLPLVQVSVRGALEKESAYGVTVVPRCPPWHGPT